MTADARLAFARLNLEAFDFPLWVEQEGADYAVARLHTALTNYYNATKDKP